MDKNELQIAQVATLTTELKSIASQVNKLEAKLDAYASHFVTAEVYELKHRELELHVQALESRVDMMGKQSSTKSWILATTSGAAGVVLALLVQFFLTHQGH